MILTPLGGRIKYRLAGRVFCARMQAELPNSRTLDQDDLIWLNVFGSRRWIARFLARARPVARLVRLGDLGYDDCDQFVPEGRPVRGPEDLPPA
ncbi:MAG TPA: hypothetical protein VD886_24815 [Herpetosiphonaceae bacterium]|nr:hypothetical protein [Herpetosiphonaceae bacterium]